MGPGSGNNVLRLIVSSGSTSITSTAPPMQRLSLGVGECIYGLGERFGPTGQKRPEHLHLERRRRHRSDLAYKNIPFFSPTVATESWSIHRPRRFRNRHRTRLAGSVQRPARKSWTFTSSRDPTPKDVLEKYTRLSGRPRSPPAWSFGLWLSTSFTTQYNEKTVNEFVDGMARRGIPLSVFHFDCFWMKERHWCDFQWDADAFPDPRACSAGSRAKGCTSASGSIPTSPSSPALFREGADNKYFLKTSRWPVFQRDAWQPGMALVDFTNPAAVQWYCGKLRTLPGDGRRLLQDRFRRADPRKRRLSRWLRPRADAQLLQLSLQQSGVQLLEISTAKATRWSSHDRPPPAARNSPSIGAAIATHLGIHGRRPARRPELLRSPEPHSGATTSADSPVPPIAALYKRWVAFGLLSTHSRLHGSESYRVPWLFDEESVMVMRHFVPAQKPALPLSLLRRPRCQRARLARHARHGH
jgi:alpha-D-xyloside xylohydrolase